MIFHLRWLDECGMSRKEYSTVYHRSFTLETKNQCLALPVPTVPIVLDRLIVLGNLTSDQTLSKKTRYQCIMYILKLYIHVYLLSH